ncbi:HlyD family secretion protein [Tepidamorphus sp. 3E244]|uniref:HlyD family secretion protein n=1 Tax=Tepidamorphus sp. 3E244 TaxID=3385498 RepID=UPI0038FC7746
MKTLRKRPRADNLVNQQRRTTNRTGRIIYGTLLTLMALAVLDYVVGDYVFLRADGLVVRDRSTIATTYLARIDTVNVGKGEAVEAGAPLLQLQSTHILEQLADLSARRAVLSTQAAQFAIRAATVTQLLPLAERREQEATKMLAKFDDLSNQKLITSARREEAMRSSFDARQDYVKLSAEANTLASELTTLEQARSTAESAFNDLAAHYAGGVVRAPVSGTVGTSIPSSGEVYRPGEQILSIYHGSPYVLAYLPRSYLFSIDVGMSVRVSDGQRDTTGVVSQILPVTEALPEEFQNTFKPRDRSQIAYIKFDENLSFPYHQKVRISRTNAFSTISRWGKHLNPLSYIKN